MNTIHPLNRTDLPAVKALLNLVGLPVSELNTAPIQFFVIKEDKILIAVGALEIYGTNAILRSIAVHQKYQNKGFGKQITHYLENRAVKMEIQHLYLLTTTAENFFKKLNYLEINRSSCPDEILASSEFAEICPSTASCLFKSLYY